MKFKVGDKVVVKSVQDLSDIDERFEEYVGQVGTIYAVDEDWEYPYEVIFGDDEDSIEYLFIDEELTFYEEPFEQDEQFVIVMPDVTYDPKPKRIIDLCNCGDSYINIKFQEGTVEENGVNGAQMEDVIDLLVKRLEGFQNGRFPCRENDMATIKLQEAKMWLLERTRKRKEQGVEGKYENHG